MPDPDSDAAPVLLVLASTFPRWDGDPEPGFVQELARRLSGRFHVIALVPHSPGAAERETMQGVEVIRFRYGPARWETLVNDGGIVTNLRRQPWKWLLVPGFVLAQLWGAWRVVRSRQVRALHAHWLVPQGLVAALLGLLSGRSPPYLVTSHGADLFALRGRVLARLKRFVAGRAAAITVVSSVMRDELARLGVAPERVVVRSMGVDLQQRFSVDPTVPRSPNEILFVGRLVEKKGLVHLIDAMPAILAGRPEAFLTVVGFGPEMAERKAQVTRLGLDAKVSFTGAMAQGDLAAHYRRAAVFVAPFVQAASGDQEGLGLVVVEAAGCGCPLVVSDLPGVRDVFAEQAPAALVPPSSVPALAAAVCSVLASPPDTAALREALRRRFDWQVVADDYSHLLSDLPDQAA